jgi:hypothetical protein
MKFWKSLIRVWFTLASLASFLVGWAVLAHAPKPNQFNPLNVPDMPQLAPVPTLKQVIFAGEPQTPGFNQRNQRAVILHSGGS